MSAFDVAIMLCHLCPYSRIFDFFLKHIINPWLEPQCGTTRIHDTHTHIGGARVGLVWAVAPSRIVLALPLALP